MNPTVYSNFPTGVNDFDVVRESLFTTEMPPVSDQCQQWEQQNHRQTTMEECDGTPLQTLMVPTTTTTTAGMQSLSAAHKTPGLPIHRVQPHHSASATNHTFYHLRCRTHHGTNEKCGKHLPLGRKLIETRRCADCREKYRLCSCAPDPAMRTVAERVKTFPAEWEETFGIPIEDAAVAGYYFLDEPSLLKCFYCGLGAYDVIKYENLFASHHYFGVEAKQQHDPLRCHYIAGVKKSCGHLFCPSMNVPGHTKNCQMCAAIKREAEAAEMLIDY